MENTGASVVITHRIMEGKQQEYENWLTEIGPLCRSAPGHMDLQIIRPIPNLTFTYTVLIRFDSIGHLRNWMESEARLELINKVRPFLLKDDEYRISSGLDFLFTPQNMGTKPPVRWKQYMVTWSAIYPLVLFIPPLLVPVLRQAALPQSYYLDTLLITSTIVFLMVYLIMPHYTRLIKKWLYG